MRLPLAIFLTGAAILSACGTDGAPRVGFESQEPAPAAEAEPSRAQVQQIVRACKDEHPMDGPGYTERDHTIYRALIDTPMSIPEDQAKRQVAERFDTTPAEVTATVDRVQSAMFGGGWGGGDPKPLIECIVSEFAEPRDVIVAGDFANVSYVERFEVLNDAELRRKALERMPMLLGALFEVPSLQRVRLGAYYPAITAGGAPAGEKRVAILEVRRSDYAPGKSADTYSDFTSYVNPE